MKVGINFWLVFFVLGLAAVCFGAEGFVEVMAGDYRGVNWELGGRDAWHKGRVCGGLGFEVAISDWPQLLQRGYLDHVEGYSGTREMQFVLRYIDLGRIRSAGESKGARPPEANWCYRRYVFGEGKDSLELTVSRVTPAVLAVTNSAKLELFAGEKYIGERWPKEGTKRLGRVHIGGGGRKKVSTKDVPGYAAYFSEGKVVTVKIDEAVDLSGMEEPWLLFWYGERSQFLRTTVPNLLWRTRALGKAMQSGEYFVEIDVPVLVVLEHKAKGLKKTEDSVEISFGEKAAGSVAILPVFGYYHPKVELTKKWAEELPGEVVERCRRWSKRMGYYPLSCSQSYAIADGRSEVTIRNEFNYIERKNDWGIKTEKIAPVPPAVMMAKRYGFGIELSGEAANEAIQTHSGSYTGITGADTVEFTIGGLDKYVNEAACSPEPETEEAKILAGELTAEIEKMVRAGPLAPAWVLGRKHKSRCEVLFANPRQTLQIIADALPYLDRAQSAKALEYAAAEMKRIDPITVSNVPVFEGTRREYYDFVDPAFFEKVTKESLRKVHKIAEDRRLDNIYALWALAEAGGDWSYLEGVWEDFKKRVGAVDSGTDWAICGHFKSSDAWAGSTQSTNAHFARYLAMVRIAEKFNDKEAKNKAFYMLAKTALRRFAQGKMIRYVYDEKFQGLESGADWMIKLSTSSGETGTAQLWVDNWTGPESDVRMPVFWDEFGPVLAYMDNEWVPKMVMFLNLTPELGRFLRDHLRDECDRFIAAVERNAPAWYVTDRESYLGKETSVDSPVNAWSIFLAKCCVQGLDGSEMMRYQDAPIFKVGDLLHMSRLVANLRAFGKTEFKPLKGAVQ